MDGETNYLMKHQMKRGTQRRTEVVAPKPHKSPSVSLPSFFPRWRRDQTQGEISLRELATSFLKSPNKIFISVIIKKVFVIDNLLKNLYLIILNFFQDFI